MIPGPSPATASTYDVTHSAGCWRWHHQCGVTRIYALAAALREALAEWRTGVEVGGEQYLTATTRAGRVAEWRAALDTEAPPPAPDRPGPAADTTPT